MGRTNGFGTEEVWQSMGEPKGFGTEEVWHCMGKAKGSDTLAGGRAKRMDNRSHVGAGVLAP